MSLSQVDIGSAVVLVTPDVNRLAIALSTARALLWSCVGLSAFLSAAEVSSASNHSTTASDPKTILVLGDSLAAGYGLDSAEAFPALIQEKIDAKGWNFKVVNAGLSGDTTAGGLRRINWVLKQKVDILVLELGGNDGLRGIPIETTRANLKGIVQRTRAKYPDAQIVIAGMRMPPNLGADYVKKFEELFPALAKETKSALVPFVLEGVGGSIELNQSDRIHPTAEGHRIVAENVWRVLQPLLSAEVADADDSNAGASQ